MKNFRVPFLLLTFLYAENLLAQGDYINWNKPNAWVDSVYSTLSENDRISQLMIIDMWPGRDSNHYRDVECLVSEQHVGGLIFFKGSPVKEVILTNFYQSLARVPLIIGMDAEWGIAMRLDSVPVFPRQMVMGASKDESEVYEFGKIVGKQCKRMGIHFNFAPDIDINNNPDNPVINDRSFGENKFWVAKLGVQYMKGLQDEHILASAKHFPGHGDVSVDSHYGLPVILADRKRLDSLELYPFRELIKKNVASVMVAHLNVPAIDSTNTPSSVSKPMITGLLKTEMGFEGLVITDALNMKGVTDLYYPGEPAAMSLFAGNDILLFAEDVPMAISMIKTYITDSLISWEQVEKSCKKMLLAKYWVGLNKYKPIDTAGLIADLNCCETELLIKRIVREGIVVARNDDHIIPIENPELYKIACVSVGSAAPTVFQEMTMNYAAADYFSIDKNEVPDYFDSLYDALSPYNLLIISLQNTSRYVSRRLGLTQPEINFINRLAMQSGKKIILACNGNPYILRNFSGIKNIIVAYEDLEMNNKLAAQVLFGAVKARGTLPVSVNEELPLGTGISTSFIHRLEYIYPEEIQIDHDPLNTIDSIVSEAIRNHAMPGCQVLVAKDGKVIYKKSFGFHTYDSLMTVKDYHLYDVASLTKILGTTIALMHLYDEGKLDVNKTLGDYLPETKNTNKEHLFIKDILMHQAGLIPFIPIYKQTLLDGKPSQLIYSDTADSNYTIRVAPHLYMHSSYQNRVWHQILASEVKAPGEYVYSDLGFILLRKVVEQLGKQDFESYLQTHIYKPLNLSTLCFNPLDKVNGEWIVPTELDSSFRQELVKGTVHDQTAAMLGGVSGHAGIFANMNDVAVIMQMLLDNGTYGSKRIIKESTVKEFTKKHFKINRRGFGFDKPETDPHKATPLSRDVSPLAFGHSGFTGTCTWVDPKYGLVYVFLSNRVYPSADNKKLADTNVRTRILDVVYEVIRKSK